ncbi:hypothetical protein I3760_04G008800 [Carya illinoinensis]|uniref:Dynamin GTPase n=1 Tax=Carya illinoinensis TaxID=32201 RepID=A0A922F9A7_CARIL|nr:hypothetical protein I3760_04G008800 [Carya illinoinensis]KAG6715727.1 hypothetical protein I3842_04G009100 [Carya illinoinensis]
MEAIEELAQLSESMRQAAALLADEDVDENTGSSSGSSRRASTFLNVVALGNVGAGKSAVLNSLIGHPVLPTGENGATRAPISIDLQRDGSLSSKSIILQIDNKSQQVSASALRHSLQDRLSKGSSGKSRDEIYLKLRTSTAPPLKLVDLPGLDQRIMDDSLVSEYAEHNDAILLVIVPASQAPEIASSRAIRVAKEYDGDGTRTIGVISKIDQAASDQKSLAAVQALLLNQGPSRVSDIPWVALIGQSVSIASAQSGSVGSESSLETAWRAESESLKSILTGAPQSKLGRIALVDALSQQIRNRMKVRLPNLLSGLQGKSQIVQDELVRLGEQMVQSSEGTRALALELCREFEDRFLLHVTSGEGAGWKIVASFEGTFPNRMKQLPLDRHFDINNVKRIVLEADGYQPYLISPEKGLRSLIKGVLELAKEPSRLCVDEVHRVLVDIVSASANATPGLGRYPPFKREVVAIASAALDGFKNEARKMVVALVDMERAFVPPQHFIRLVQRRMERQRREEELKTRSSKKGHEAEQATLNRAESVADKSEWMNKIRNVIQPSRGGQMKSEGGMRQSHSDGYLDTMARKPADPEEELRWMSQEVRGYVEAVLNSLAANVPKAVVLCQVEKAKEDMLNQLYSSVSAQSTARIEELLQEDRNVKGRRERYQKQSSLLSKLTRQLSVHDNQAAAASNWSNGGGTESSPRTNGPSGDDWRSAFDAAANGSVDYNSYGDNSRSGSNGHSRHHSDPAQNGDVNSGSNSGSRRTPNRLPPPPPQSGSSSYKYY